MGALFMKIHSLMTRMEIVPKLLSVEMLVLLDVVSALGYEVVFCRQLQ
jgi:hypothetical protein